jgi:hypothetical protein
METIKTTGNNNRFDGLGLLILIAGVVLFSPFCYFLLNIMLGNEHPVYISY